MIEANKSVDKIGATPSQWSQQFKSYKVSRRHKIEQDFDLVSIVQLKDKQKGRRMFKDHTNSFFILLDSTNV